MRVALIALASFAVAALPASALTVETHLSSKFQEKLKDDYGVREGGILSEALANRVEKIFNREGIAADRVVVTIEDAKPNRPTFEQVSDRPGLDPIRSISLGGARIVGVAYDASGKELGSLDYDWYETDLSNSLAVSTWSDARWTFSRFAERFADRLG
ncbi:MAG: hypothetical protein SGJ21_10390 [Alphaproteobacteria bacterium]|nr:hypothetical protein [Alphaproteobacteria bacterium]